MCSFQEKKHFFFVYNMTKCPHTSKPHMETFLILCQMVLFLNFLISKQNKTPKIDPKILKQ